MFRNILCKLGFHSWIEMESEAVVDMEEGYDNPRFVTYRCSNCKRDTSTFKAS